MSNPATHLMQLAWLKGSDSIQAAAAAVSFKLGIPDIDAEILPQVTIPKTNIAPKGHLRAYSFNHQEAKDLFK